MTRRAGAAAVLRALEAIPLAERAELLLSFYPDPPAFAAGVAVCWCGWEGKPRDRYQLLILDTLKHAAETGHNPAAKAESQGSNPGTRAGGETPPARG